MPIDNLGMVKDMLSQAPEGEDTGGDTIDEGNRVTLDTSVIGDMNAIEPGAEIGVLIKGTVAGKSEVGVDMDISSVEVSGAKTPEEGERPVLGTMLGGIK